MEKPHVFDVVKFEKEKAIARFNIFRRIATLRQIVEVLVVLGVISWSSPAVAKKSADCFVRLSAYLLNHHVVFLIGNAIIVLLFVLCRQNDAVSCSATDCDMYDNQRIYVRNSEQTALPPREDGSGGDEEKQIVVVCAEEGETTAVSTRQCDDVAAAIEKAARQIKRFQRTQSEKLRREICVRPQAELRRSETQSRRRSVSSGAEEMERLSSEEFRRTVDAFIDKHWSKKTTKQSLNQFEEYEKYHHLLKMA